VKAAWGLRRASIWWSFCRYKAEQQCRSWRKAHRRFASYSTLELSHPLQALYILPGWIRSVLRVSREIRQLRGSEKTRVAANRSENRRRTTLSPPIVHFTPTR
jgi:hypothetical protein